MICTLFCIYMLHFDKIYFFMSVWGWIFLQGKKEKGNDNSPGETEGWWLPSRSSKTIQGWSQAFPSHHCRTDWCLKSSKRERDWLTERGTRLSSYPLTLRESSSSGVSPKEGLGGTNLVWKWDGGLVTKMHVTVSKALSTQSGRIGGHLWRDLKPPLGAHTAFLGFQHISDFIVTVEKEVEFCLKMVNSLNRDWLWPYAGNFQEKILTTLLLIHMSDQDQGSSLQSNWHGSEDSGEKSTRGRKGALQLLPWKCPAGL